MKDKEQIRWEERKIIEKILKEKPQLTVESNLIIFDVHVKHMIYEYKERKKFAIIEEENTKGKAVLEKIGVRTLQTNYANENILRFLIEYIFRK